MILARCGHLVVGAGVDCSCAGGRWLLSRQECRWVEETQVSLWTVLRGWGQVQRTVAEFEVMVQSVKVTLLHRIVTSTVFWENKTFFSYLFLSYLYFSFPSFFLFHFLCFLSFSVFFFSSIYFLFLFYSVFLFFLSYFYLFPFSFVIFLFSFFFSLPFFSILFFLSFLSFCFSFLYFLFLAAF